MIRMEVSFPIHFGFFCLFAGGYELQASLLSNV